jgi:hypothetical protein
MDALFFSIVLVLFAIAHLMMIANVSSLRKAIGDIAPERESGYMLPSPLYSPMRVKLRLPVFFGRPPAVLAASAEFRASLRLMRILGSWRSS